MFKFKKVASIFASAVMLSSTIASATMYPAPYNMASKTAIIYGSDANAADMTAANMVMKDLNEQLVIDSVTEDTSEDTVTDVTDGESFMVEKSTNKFNLGEDFADFYTSFDDGELPKVLASLTYKNDVNDEFDYDQKITPTNALTITHFADSEFNEYDPMVGMDLSSGTQILNYTLDFDDTAEGNDEDFGDLETTEIEMLGKVFYISQAENTTNGPKLTLLDTANEGIVAQGESTTMTIGSGESAKDYDVSLTFIDSNNVIFDVSGVRTNKLTEGATYKIAEDTYIGVKSILYDSKESGISQVEFTIGSGKIVMENGEEVQLNGEDISTFEDANGYSHVVNAYITAGGTDNEGIDQIKLEWLLDDDAWLVKGKDLVMPGFETIKISMTDWVEPSEEVTKVENDGSDSFKLSTTVKDGDVDLNLLYLNATEDGFDGLGDSSTKLLLTATGSNPTLTFSNIDNVEWFPASYVSGDDAESYILQITKIDDSTPVKNTTTIRNKADNSEKTLDIDETETWGNVEITLTAANEASKTATLTLAAAGSGTAYADRVYTKDGLMMRLPVNSATTTITDGGVNLTRDQATWVMNFTEEDEDNTIGAGLSFTATLGASDSETTVTTHSLASSDFETADGSDKFVAYVSSPLATKVILDQSGDQDTFEVTYHDEESYAKIYVSEVGATVSSSSGGSGKILTPILDTEASTVESKNWIVVGGSCVNQVAATLIGADYKTCAADWTAKTNVGAGQFLIASYDRGSNKVATLIAGYDVEDTDNAAKFLTTQENVDTSAGKKYIGTTATSATLV